VRVSAFQRRASIGICGIFLLAGLAWPGGPVRREVALSDVPLRLREFLPAQEFPRLLDALKARTAAREQAGEYDHLIHYLLQSRAFTARPRIEPALSAREWVEGGKAIPEAVRLRMQDFLAALGQPATDVRMAYFQTMNADLPLLDREYRRAMDFLYKKEFGAGGAALYQERGHSTDSQFEANYAVYIGLAALKSKKPELALVSWAGSHPPAPVLAPLLERPALPQGNCAEPRAVFHWPLWIGLTASLAPSPAYGFGRWTQTQRKS
jgi:hypothetical protein